MTLVENYYHLGCFMITLMDFMPQDRGRVVGYHCSTSYYRQSLMAMGLTPNTEFEFVRRAPLGDPVALRVRNTVICLRQDEAVLLKLERV